MIFKKILIKGEYIMARPKVVVGEDTAYQKIEKAFWAELSEKEYTKITIASLAKRAGVNHNTLYYHFSSIDEMAYKLFYQNLENNETAQFLFQSVLNHTDINIFLNQPDIQKRLQRSILFARGDSAYLLNIFQEAVLNIWLGSCNLTLDELSCENQLALQFIFGGFTSILGSPKYVEHPEIIAYFPTSEIGKAIIKTLAQIQVLNNK